MSQDSDSGFLKHFHHPSQAMCTEFSYVYECLMKQMMCFYSRNKMEAQDLAKEPSNAGEKQQQKDVTDSAHIGPKHIHQKSMSQQDRTCSNICIFSHTSLPQALLCPPNSLTNS